MILGEPQCIIHLALTLEPLLLIDRTLCAIRHQATSMTVGIIAKLRGGFGDVGRKGSYRPTTLQRDPCRGAR